MRRIRILLRRFRSLFLSAREDEDLRREMDLHVEELARELAAGGMSRVEAMRQARREFGSVERAKEECRDTRRVGLAENVVRDVAFAGRMLRKSPGFTITAVASLALGIGANTAIFQLFEAVRLRPLPVERPEELVAVRIRGEGRSGNFRGRNSQFSYSVWSEIQRAQSSLAGVFAYGDTPVNLSPGGELRNVEGVWVSGSLFPVLGVRPQLGRLFSREDDRPGCGWPGAVISDGFWQREFSGDPEVLTRTLSIEGHAVPVVGVTPKGFFGLEVGRQFDVALPICSAAATNLQDRMFWFLSVMGRLGPGASEEAARAEYRAMSRAVFEATVPAYQPRDQAKYTAMVLDIEGADGGQSEFRESLERPLTYLLWMVALVLLLASANLANMMLARGTAREHEFAVRRSMGATRGRLIQQVLIEGFLLAAAGAVLGVLVAPAIGRTVIAMLSTDRDPLYLALDWNGRLLVFTIAIALATTLLFGLAPAFRAGRTTTRGSSDSREKLVFRRLLLGGQVALCMVLLTAALLFAQNFRNLLTTSPGFESKGVLVASVFLDARRYPAAGRAAVIDRLHQRISAIPGATGVARNLMVPISGSGWDRGAFVNPADPPQYVNLAAVSEGYWRVMNMPLLAGRDFRASDRLDTMPVAIVNQAFSRTFFAGQNPVGRTFRLDGPEPLFEIIGLTGDSKYRTLKEEFTPIVYLFDRQRPVAETRVRFFIRTPGKPEALFHAVKQVVLESDPQLTMRFVVLRTQIEESVLRERLMAALTGAFGGLGMLLALTGVFGVTAYIVSRRYREFGVRIAVGATPGQILRMILGEIAVTLGAGIAAGGLLALGAGGLLSSVLYGLTGGDLSTLITVVVVLGAGGLLAGVIPAMRASRVGPVEALRLE